MMKASKKKSADDDFSLIFKLYARALFPSVIAVLGGTVNVLFDGILVGQKLGDAGLEAVNMSLPLSLILCALGSLIASGAAQLSAMAFGRADMEEGRRVFSSALTLGAIVALAFCAVALPASRPIAAALSRPDTFDYVLAYVRIIPIGGIFKVLLYIPFFYLRLEGKNRFSMLIMLSMTAINIALDYVFLFVCDMSIAGAAWANAIGTAAACIMGFAFLCSRGGNFKFSFSMPRLKDIAGISRFGAMMALDNTLAAAKIFTINRILMSIPVAGMTAIFSIANNIFEFSICLQNGVPQASGAMTGMLYAEQDAPSLKKLLATQLGFGALLSAGLALLLSLFAPGIAGWFGSGEDASFAVRMLAVSLVFATANNTMCYYYNATGNVGLANLITACRSYALVALFCLVFAGQGERIWAFFPAAEIATLAVFIAAGTVHARKKGLGFFFLLDDAAQKALKSMSLSVPYIADEISSSSARIQEFCEECSLDPKTAMAVSLSVEEMLAVLSEEADGEGRAYLRLVIYGQGVILRLRCGGKKFNPLTLASDPKYLGMRLLAGLAKNTEYQHTLGVNTFAIFI